MRAELPRRLRRALLEHDGSRRARSMLSRLAARVMRRQAAAESIHFAGDYGSWAEALRDADGYDDEAIYRRVRDSALRVQAEPGLYERDGVIFDEPQWNFALMACLLRIASRRGNTLRVLDFGGSLGSTYHQVRPFMQGSAR